MLLATTLPILHSDREGCKAGAAPARTYSPCHSARAAAEPEADAAAQAEPPPWAGTRPAAFYLQGRRERRAAEAASSGYTYGALKVQPAVEVPRTIDEIMERVPKKKAGRIKAAGASGAAARRDAGKAG